MCAPRRLRDPRTRRQMFIANLSLAVGLGLWFLVPRALAKTHPCLDSLSGMFIGVSIAANLLALYRPGRCAPLPTPHPQKPHTTSDADSSVQRCISASSQPSILNPP